MPGTGAEEQGELDRAREHDPRQHLAALRPQASEAGAHQPAQQVTIAGRRQRELGVSAWSLDLLDERVDHRRVACGLLGDSPGQMVALRRGRTAPQAQRELGGGLGGERGRLDHPQHIGGGDQRPQQRDVTQHRRGLVTTVRADQQEWWHTGRGEQVVQHAGAVEVAPLQVVEQHNQRTALGDAKQQALEAVEGAAAHLLRLEHARRYLLADPGHAREHRKDLRQGIEALADVVDQRLALLAGDPRQVSRERVEEAVERAKRHRLAGRARTLEHHDVGRWPELGHELAHQRRLTGAGGPDDVDAGGLAGEDLFVGDAQDLELRFTLDKLARHHLPRARRGEPGAIPRAPGQELGDAGRSPGRRRSSAAISASRSRGTFGFSVDASGGSSYCLSTMIDIAVPTKG
jgi:hypothetical protein